VDARIYVDSRVHLVHRIHLDEGLHLVERLYLEPVGALVELDRILVRGDQFRFHRRLGAERMTRM
jgi:hypothetical protein